MKITILSVNEPQDKLRDLDMVLHPEKWPCYPFLPLRHTEKRDPSCPSLPLLGFVLPDKPTHVIIGCVHLTVLGVQEIESLAEEAYKTASEMLEQWTVD